MGGLGRELPLWDDKMVGFIKGAFGLILNLYSTHLLNGFFILKLHLMLVNLT